MANEIAFYSMETSHFCDVKIKRLRRQFGCEGYSVWAYIINEIYRVNHYFYKVDENTIFDIEDYWGISSSRIQDIILFCVEINLFDSTLFSQYSILTSKSIQNRFIELCKRTHRKHNICSNYYLLNDNNVKSNQHNVVDYQIYNNTADQCTHENSNISDNVQQSSTKSEDIANCQTLSDNVQQSSTKSENVVLNKIKLNNNSTPFIPLDGGNTSPTKFDNSSKENIQPPKSTAKRCSFTIDTNNPPAWISPSTLQCYSDWIEYKCEKGQAYKSEKSARACYDQLLQLASGNSQTAQAIVLQSIAANYTGLFPLKTTTTQQPNNFVVRNTQTKIYTKI